jgi:predicted RNA-binding protein with RPS1 domain
VSTSQEVEVMVLDVDMSKRRISLGLKQCMANPWESFADQYPAGTEIEGEVRNITEFGLFVGLPGDIDGMVHLSDLSWDKAGEEAIRDYKKGDQVQVKVLDVDMDKERISLGIKQLANDPFEKVGAVAKKGDVVTVIVAGIQDNGIDVTVQDGIPGFIRKTEGDGRLRFVRLGRQPGRHSGCGSQEEGRGRRRRKVSRFHHGLRQGRPARVGLFFCFQGLRLDDTVIQFNIKDLTTLLWA